MSILENLSDLAHELRCAAGTVLTILGSRLEARERARVECGPQWLTEFEEQRDSLEPDGQLFECSAPTCGCHDDPRYQAFPAPEDSAVAAADPCSCGAGYTSAAECPWCREVGDCICWVGHGDCGGCSGVVGISHEPACGWQWDPSCPQHGDGLKASAASALAADPSPTVPNAHSVVGGEGPGGASDIPQSAPPGQPHCQCGDPATCMYPVQPVPPVVAGESPRGVSTDQPSLGELEAAWREFTDGVATFGIEVEDVYAASQMRLLADRIDPPTAVSHEDLAAHLTGAAIRSNTGHPDVLIDAFASSLLADFNITRREAARE